jgi:hypothetical protein
MQTELFSKVYTTHGGTLGGVEITSDHVLGKWSILDFMQYFMQYFMRYIYIVE